MCLIAIIIRKKIAIFLCILFFVFLFFCQLLAYSSNNVKAISIDWRLHITPDAIIKTFMTRKNRRLVKFEEDL